MEIVCMLVVLALYGAGMYMWGYRRALEKAMGDMQEMENNMTKEVGQGEIVYRSDVPHCSICGKVIDANSYYCKWCGAKMKGGTE